MESVPPCPTNMAALPRLLSYGQGQELERHRFRAKRGVPTLALALGVDRRYLYAVIGNAVYRLQLP